MLEAAEKKNIIPQVILWMYLEVPKSILRGWRNFIVFGFNYFSTPLLIKSLFAPWRRYQSSYGKGFHPQRFFEILVSNLISRILGAFMRSILIIVGLLFGTFIIFAGIIIFLGWILLPIVAVFGLWWGMSGL